MTTANEVGKREEKGKQDKETEGIAPATMKRMTYVSSFFLFFILYF
jgi:hypothetical protein